VKNLKLFLTILIILLINITLTGFLLVSVKRPLIYYEYLFLPVVLILAAKHLYRTIILIGLTLLDIIYNVSHVYFFDLFNYVEKLPSLLITKFSILFWVGIVFSLSLFILLCHFLIILFEKKLAQFKTNMLIPNILLSCFLFLVVYGIDFLNGDTLMSKKPYGYGQLNIGKSIIKDVYDDFGVFKKGRKKVHELSDFKNINSDSSLAYKYFYNSTENNEVLVMIESWGLMENETLRSLQLLPFTQLDTSKYSVRFEKSYFGGGTTPAESRELLNKEGEGYYAVINHNSCDIKSLIQRKNELHYYTSAVQSFSTSYSLGQKFREILGFKNIKGYTYFHDTLKLPQNFNNHYEAVDDEAVFSYIFKNQSKNLKSFTYCLTINTHLPFVLSKEQKVETGFQQIHSTYGSLFPSEETMQRYYRMNQELKYLAALISKNDVDKVLIIGDHAPPFVFNSERDFFSSEYVPALIIEKKKIQYPSKPL